MLIVFTTALLNGNRKAKLIFHFFSARKKKSFYIPYDEHMILKLIRIKIKDNRGINDRTS